MRCNYRCWGRDGEVTGNWLGKRGVGRGAGGEVKIRCLIIGVGIRYSSPGIRKGWGFTVNKDRAKVERVRNRGGMGKGKGEDEVEGLITGVVPQGVRNEWQVCL